MIPVEPFFDPIKKPGHFAPGQMADALSFNNNIDYQGAANRS